MRFGFEVGDQEKHEVAFSWQTSIGMATITVDGRRVLRSKPLAFGELEELAKVKRSAAASLALVAGMVDGSRRPELMRAWMIEVGEREQHQVIIEKQRPLAFAAFRPHDYRVFVDGTLVAEHRG